MDNCEVPHFEMSRVFQVVADDKMGFGGEIDTGNARIRQFGCRQ